MITLGLVDSVDTNGVYVTMPGSRGVLRGPYKSLSTVAAGTTVLVASTDDGEQVVVGPSPAGDGVVSVLSYGAVGDGVADDTAPIQSAMTAAAGKAVVFPAGYTFRITDGVTVPTGTTIIGYGSTIRQDTKHKPCLDMVQKSDVTILGLSFLTTLTRTYTGGTTFRGADVFVNWCGVYASGSRITVRDCDFDGFTAGVLVTKWDDTDMTGNAEDITVENCTVQNVDFGVLADATDRLTVRRLSGSWAAQSGSSAPPHLFYAAGGTAERISYDMTVEDVRGWGSTDGHCVQVKDTVGAVISRVFIDGCNGLLSVDNVTSLLAEHLTAVNDTLGLGSIYMQADCVDVTIRDVSIQCAAGDAATERAGRIAGTRVTAQQLYAQVDWDDDGSWEWYVLGTDVTISGIESAGTGGSPYVMGIDGSNYGASHGIHVSAVTAPNCYASGALRIFGDVTGSVELNADRVAALVNASGLTGTVHISTNGDTFTHPGTKAGFFGTAPITKPTVTGSRGGNAALASALTALANLGLITDSSS